MCVQNTFADNMRELRLRAGLSQEGLAEKSGLHRTYIGSIEQRRANISLKNVERIADALHVDPAVLFIDGTEARERVVAGCSTALEQIVEDVPRLAPGDYALCEWDAEGSVNVQRIGVYSEDMTLRLLCILVEEGYAENLDELVAAYDKAAGPILDFARSFKGRELARRQELFVEKLGLDAEGFGELLGEEDVEAEEANAAAYAALEEAAFGGYSDWRGATGEGADGAGGDGEVGGTAGTASDAAESVGVKAVAAIADAAAGKFLTGMPAAAGADMQDLKGFLADIVKEAVSEYFDERGSADHDPDEDGSDVDAS